MPITHDDVRALAAYARIALTDGETDEMCAYLNEAVELLSPLLSYDLEGVEPTFHPVGGMANATRADKPEEGLSAHAALANAADTCGRYFRVPAILQGRGEA